MMTFIVTDRVRKTLMDRIVKHTGKGSLYYTDKYTAYAVLEARGTHRTASHSKDEYVRDDAHINGMEGFWRYAKNWLYQYRGVS